ncbi:MAG: hypothetical protein AAGE03_14000 [Pseudomonadota bacterium]
MTELRAEIGSEDLAMILGVYLDEAEEMLASLGTPLSDEDRGKALHFLRSGALNLGLSGLASAANGADVDRTALIAAFDETRRVITAHA